MDGRLRIYTDAPDDGRCCARTGNGPIAYRPTQRRCVKYAQPYELPGGVTVRICWLHARQADAAGYVLLDAGAR